MNATKVSPASGTIKQTRAQDSQLLAEIRELCSEISGLKMNPYDHRSPRSQPRGQGQNRGRRRSLTYAVHQEVTKVVQTKDWDTPVSIAINVDHPNILGSFA